MRILRVLAAALAASLLLAACGNSPDATGSTDAASDTTTEEALGEVPAEAGGAIEIDGSSTVAPLTEAIAEEFANVGNATQVNVGTSGTGGGFERFCDGETDISDASRPIKDEEAQLCADAGVEFTELRVGTDALTVVVNPANDFATCLTFDQLITIFGAPGVENWSEVDPSFPDLPLSVFAPDADSGTFDFFLETLGIDEEPGARPAYNASADDNVIVTGVQGEEGGWGYFGFAFFQNNAEALTAVEVDGGDGCTAPSVETAQDGSYPLTRPLLIYVKNEALARPEVQAFASYYLATVGSVIVEVGYIPEPDTDLAEAAATLAGAIAAAG